MSRRQGQNNSDSGLLNQHGNVQNTENSDFKKPELHNSHSNHVDARPKQGQRSKNVKQRMADEDDICSLRISNIANSLLQVSESAVFLCAEPNLIYIGLFQKLKAHP